jgi:hypothetical protein
MEFVMEKQLLSNKMLVEVFSAFAVIISLIFVGLEMNENTKATRSSIAVETNSTISAWYNTIASDPQNSKVLLDFMRNPLCSTLEEKYQAILMVHSFMLILQNTFYLEDEGTLDSNVRESITKILVIAPGMRYFWKQRKVLFTNQRYIDFVDESLLGEGLHSEALYGASMKCKLP